MHTGDIWSVLEIEPTTSKRDIKRAYANAVKYCHPEEKPEEYERLKAAYEAALRWTGQRVELPKEAEHTPKEKGSSELLDKLGQFQETEEEAENTPQEQESFELLDKLEQLQEKKELSELGRKVLNTFIQDFSDNRKRKDKGQWKSFFLQDDFLRVQFEVGFVEKLDEYLREQQLENYYDLPTTFIIEMVIAYGLVLEDDGYIQIHSTWDDEFERTEPCSNIIANIWNMQNGQYSIMKGSSFLKKPENMTRFASFFDYHLLRTMAERGFLLPERRGEWKEIIFQSREGNIMQKNKSKVSASFVPKRHECLLDLYGFLVENYDLPMCVCEEIYNTNELQTANQKELSQKYIRIRDAILKKYPGIAGVDIVIERKADYMDVTRKFGNICQKYCYYHWIVVPDEMLLKLGLVDRKPNVSICSEEEWAEVEELLHSEEFLSFAFEKSFLEKLSSIRLSYYSAIQLYRFYTKNGKGQSFVQSLFRTLEEYLLINECLMNVSEEEEAILQRMQEETLEIFKEMGVESQKLGQTTYDRQICGFCVHTADDFAKHERVDVSALTGEEKAEKLFEIMRANRENMKPQAAAYVTFPHLEEIPEPDKAADRSEVEKKFAEQYSYLDNNYIILKYGIREAEATERIIAFGLVNDQENLFDIVGNHARYYAYDRQSSSVIRKAGDTTYAVGWYWNALDGMRPIMQGESQNFYNKQGMTVKAIESFAKYLNYALYLEYVTQIIVCDGSICIEYDL